MSLTRFEGGVDDSAELGEFGFRRSEAGVAPFAPPHVPPSSKRESASPLTGIGDKIDVSREPG